MKVLIHSDDSMLSDIMAVALEAVLSAACIQATRPEEAVGAMRASREIDLVISESDQSAGEVLDEARKRRVPLIRLTGPQGDLRPGGGEREYLLSKPLDVQDLIDLVRLVVKGDPDQLKDDLFCRVRLDTLLMVGTQFDFEIFLRLSGTKYVKVVRKGDIFDGEKYAHFQNKGVTHLFVPRDEFLSYLSTMASCLHRLLHSDAASLEESIVTTTRIFESMQEGFRSIGITPEAQRVIKLTVNLAVRSIERNPNLKKLLQVLSKNQESFLAWHSVALSYIACKLCSLMTWDSQNTHYKLALAAMLHDIALVNPDWARFESLDEARAAGLTEADLESYRNHPLQAGDLAKQLADFPGDVDYVIAQHHELPDGSGFPSRQNHTKISPISCLFIIAHDLCHRLHVEGPSFDFLRYLESFDRRYPLGYFRKIRANLEKVGAEELASQAQ
jgi:hypothetical protein